MSYCPRFFHVCPTCLMALGCVSSHGSPNLVPSQSNTYPKLPSFEWKEVIPQISGDPKKKKHPSAKVHPRQGLHQALSCHALLIPEWTNGWKGTSKGTPLSHQKCVAFLQIFQAIQISKF